ncbi:hypothetical protein Lal_00022849 [Lupinus albus]|nr:hypothetical protein Lal_00022849 [Lupinus albus]
MLGPSPSPSPTRTRTELSRPDGGGGGGGGGGARARACVCGGFVCVSPHPLTKPIVPLGAHPNDVSWYCLKVQADYQPRRPQDKTAQISVIRYLTAL